LDPIETKCGHIFGQAALKKYADSKKIVVCPLCRAPINILEVRENVMLREKNLAWIRA
jgi:hypothetical protein